MVISDIEKKWRAGNHVKKEIEIGVIRLQVKEWQGLPIATRGQESHMDSPVDSPNKQTNKQNQSITALPVIL